MSNYFLVLSYSSFSRKMRPCAYSSLQKLTTSCCLNRPWGCDISTHDLFGGILVRPIWEDRTAWNRTASRQSHGLTLGTVRQRRGQETWALTYISGILPWPQRAENWLQTAMQQPPLIHAERTLEFFRVTSFVLNGLSLLALLLAQLSQQRRERALDVID